MQVIFKLGKNFVKTIKQHKMKSANVREDIAWCNQRKFGSNSCVLDTHFYIEKDKTCDLSVPSFLMPMSAPLALDRMVKLRRAKLICK